MGPALSGWRGAVAARRHGLALAAIVAIAAALRFADLGAAPLWLDEAYSVWFSDQGWRFLWTETPAFETHPPFYYSLLKLWRSVAGSGEAALRAPSALASLGVVVLLCAAGRAAGGARLGWALGLMAASLAALWRSQIEFAQDARPYAFAALGVALLMAGALRVLNRPRSAAMAPMPLARADPWTAAGFGAIALGMALTLWSHNLGVVSAGLAGLFLAGWWAATGWSRGLFVNLAITAAIAALLYAPNMPVLLAQSRALSGGFWIEAPATLWELSRTSVQIYGQPALPGLGANKAAALTVLLLALGVAGMRRAARGEGGAATVAFLLTMFAGPWLALVAFTYLVQPVLLPRTLIFVAPPALLTLAAIPWAAPVRLRSAAGAALLVFAAAGALRPTGIFAGDRSYGEIVRLIARSADPHAPVLVAPNSVALALGYYAGRQGAGLDLRPLPAPYPARGPGFSHPAGGGGVAGIDADIAAKAVRETENAPVIWMVDRRLDLFDPDAALTKRLIAGGRCRLDVPGDGDIAVTLSRFGRCGGG
jgi:uncharacterized membrane protein